MTPPSTRVIRAVAREEEVPPVDLPPLFDAVDPDALDDICTDGDRAAAVDLRFAYAGHVVHVRDGSVSLDGDDLT
ncbi:MAG: HalOD1 output domain-containing protein [Halobacteriaceae archaeon]